MPERADFEAMYAASSDPFGVGTTWYEQRKQQVVLSSLTRPGYELAWDCACGTGHLALALAERCDRVLASDGSTAATGLTSRLTRSETRVRSSVSRLPGVPAGARKADLTVAAEVLYYLDDGSRSQTMGMLAAQHGEIVSVHWRHHPHDAYLSGAAVTEELDRALARRWRRVVAHDDEDFVLGIWRDDDDSGGAGDGGADADADTVGP